MVYSQAGYGEDVASVLTVLTVILALFPVQENVVGLDNDCKCYAEVSVTDLCRLYHKPHFYGEMLSR